MKRKRAVEAGFIQKIFRQVELRPRLALVLLTLAALAPFVAKPFSMDDPLFLWAAKNIQASPANPYNFTVNWYGTPAPMWDVTKNPPVACYYLALAGTLLGWSELALHCAFLLPAVAVILGTHRLARQLSDRPIYAAVATLCMPVFLVCGTSLMCDMMMLAFWIWAVALWVEGMAKTDSRRLAASAVLMTLAATTKYFGVCLVPLLVGYSLLKRRRIGSWALFFLIPIGSMVVYQWVTFHLYGRGLFGDAANFANQEYPFEISQVPANGLTALAFTGGCTVMATLLAPWLWRGRSLIALIAGSLVFALAVFGSESWWKKHDPLFGSTHVLLGAQVAFWSMGGVCVLALAALEAWQCRKADAYLLAAWIGGTFFFAGFLNWTVNGRSILPMAPAVAVLIARRMGPKVRPEKKPSRTTSLWPVAITSCLTALLALLVTGADYHFARIARQAARETYAKYGNGPGKLWFLGHWGWQYYMEDLGSKALNAGQPPPPDRDFLAIPYNNTNIAPPNKKMAQLQEKLTIGENQWLSVSSEDVAAGFHSSLWGPIPFAFGTSRPETVYVYVIGLSR